MRDPEVIDSELRLLLSIRQMVCLIEGRPPSTAHVNALLDERSPLSYSPCLLDVDRG